MWKATLSAYDGDRYRAGRHRAGRPGRRRWGPHLLVQRVRGALLGTSATQSVSGPWQAHAMWQVCGISRMPSGTADGSERPVER